MKVTSLTTLVIANAIALVACHVLTRLGVIDPLFAVPSLIVGMQLAVVALGAAVALGRRNRQRSDEACFPSSCA